MAESTDPYRIMIEHKFFAYDETLTAQLWNLVEQSIRGEGAFVYDHERLESDIYPVEELAVAYGGLTYARYDIPNHGRINASFPRPTITKVEFSPCTVVVPQERLEPMSHGLEDVPIF